MGRGDDAHICADRDASADCGVFPFLQHAEQAGLRLGRHVADLVEKQRAAFRLLEDRTWYPVGSNRLEKLKARVVCATNARLLDQVSGGRFREDLYYRLKVGYLRIPPLRERQAAIVPLAQAFLARIRRSRGRGFQKLSAAAEAALVACPWPGNVRQLYHVLEQAALLHDGAVLDAAHLRDLLPAPQAAAHAAPAAPAPATLDPAKAQLPPDGFDLDQWEKSVVAAALALNDGSPVRTAAYLRISRKVLYTLRKRYGLLGARDGQ